MVHYWDIYSSTYLKPKKMEKFKNYFKKWSIVRIIRAVLAGALLISFYYYREFFLLFIGIMLGAQAIFNISCPGGSCETTFKSEEKPKMEFEKYEPKK